MSNPISQGSPSQPAHSHKPHHLRNAIPPAAHHVKGWRYFAGLFGGEHIAATEFVIGVTFVTMGVGTRELLLGLLIGNLLAVASWTLVTTPIAIRTRRSLFTYLEHVTGPYFSKIYNLAILLYYGALAAAMITVSAYSLRFAFGLPVQLEWYPTSFFFIVITLVLAAVVITVAALGFEAMANFATICSPWMLACFICGAAIALPILSQSTHGTTMIHSFADFMDSAKQTIWIGTTPDGKPGISMWEVAAFAWANGAMVHLGLIDMAIFRFAKKKYYGLFSSVGMFLGHYVAWISAGLMGAGAAVLAGKALIDLDSADVAFATLGYIGIFVVICAGWTTANACLYRAGLAAATLLPKFSRRNVTAGVGVIIAVSACFPFVARSVMPLTVYGAMLLAPIGAIVIAEHYFLKKLGLTRYWSHYLGHKLNPAALVTWGIALAFSALMLVTGAMSFYYIFVPEYIIALILYPVLSAWMGAKANWPKKEAQQAERERALRHFERKRIAAEAAAAEEEEEPPEEEDNEDPSTLHTGRLAKGLLLGAAIMLASMVAFSIHIAFVGTSPKVLGIMRHDFFIFAITCTVSYFIMATLAMRVTDANEDSSGA